MVIICKQDTLSSRVLGQADERPDVRTMKGCMQDTFARATHSAGRPSAARDDRVSCILEERYIACKIMMCICFMTRSVFAQKFNMFLSVVIKITKWFKLVLLLYIIVEFEICSCARDRVSFIQLVRARPCATTGYLAYNNKVSHIM